MNWPAIASRIETLREQAGIGKKNLAQAVGYTPSMMTRILKGERGIGPSGLINFANFFDVPLQVLLHGPLPEEEPLVQFKDEDKAVFTEALYPRAKGYAFRFADTYRLLHGEPFALKQARTTLTNPMEGGEVAARNLRDLCKQPTGRLTSMVEFITSLGIAVAEVDDPSNRLKGVTFRWTDDIALIAMDAQLRVASKRFLLAHELGHLVLEGRAGAIQRKRNQRHDLAADFFSTDPFEQAANSFAGRLLLPDADLQPYTRGRHELKSGNPVDVWQEVIAHLSREYGVSGEMVYWRLSQSGMFSQTLARKHKSYLYNHNCSQVALDTVFTDSEACTRLTLKGIQPSNRYLSWVKILAARESIGQDDANYLLGPHMEAA